MGLLVGMNAVCNWYVNQWRLYICFVFWDLDVKGLVFRFLLDRVWNPLQSGMKGSDVNLLTVLVISLLEWSCLINNILIGLVDIL